MKPSWKNAPEWANYLVRGSDGLYWWHENKPIKGVCAFYPAVDSRTQLASDYDEYTLTLEKRS